MRISQVRANYNYIKKYGKDKVINREGTDMKATDRHKTCPDCGVEFIGHYRAERCEDCKLQYNRDYKAKWGRDNREVNYKKKREEFWASRKKGLKRTDREHTCPSCGVNHVAHYSRPKCDSCRDAYRKEKDKEYNDNRKETPTLKVWQKKNEEKIRKQNKEKYLRNRDRIRDLGAINYQKNKERLRPVRKRWREANPDKCKEYTKVWKEKHPEHCLRLGVEANGRRRALLYEAVLPSTCTESIKKIIEKCVRLSVKTGVKYHVDHIIPLSKGGAHHQDNLRIITATENVRKNATYDPSLGGLWANNKLAKRNRRKYEQSVEQ